MPDNEIKNNLTDEQAIHLSKRILIGNKYDSKLLPHLSKNMDKNYSLAINHDYISQILFTIIDILSEWYYIVYLRYTHKLPLMKIK